MERFLPEGDPFSEILAKAVSWADHREVQKGSSAAAASAAAALQGTALIFAVCSACRAAWTDPGIDPVDIGPAPQFANYCSVMEILRK